MQVEAHNGSGWDVQAEMSYNGLGQRLSMESTGVITHYVVGGDYPLVADSNGNATFYLYGLGPIAEKTNNWAYSLVDGTNTPRQLTSFSGEITSAGRFTPWGDVLEYYGTGNFTFGYFGGLMDVATGLLYVGNGQYYDPSTGRFITRQEQSNGTNPYVPWGNPIGALLSPLAVVGMIYGRKRSKTKFDHMIIGLLLIGGLAGSLAACAPSSVISTNSPTLPPPIVVIVTAPDTTPTDIVTPTNTPTPLPLDINNYDPAIAPTSITWNPSMDVPLSPSIVENVAFSQYEPNAEQIDPDLEMGGNLCGQIDLTMIANADILLDAWTTYQTISATTASRLLDIAMAIFPGQWAGKSYIYGESRYLDTQGNESYNTNESWSGTPYGSDADSAFQRMLNQNHYVIANVQINVDESGWSRVTTSKGTSHWVIVTGMSAQWNSSNKESPANWIRINNPFNNRKEYYPWKDFYGSLGYEGWSLVEIWRK